MKWCVIGPNGGLRQHGFELFSFITARQMNMNGQGEDGVYVTVFACDISRPSRSCV
jgi:hypothetical protein